MQEDWVRVMALMRPDMDATMVQIMWEAVDETGISSEVSIKEFMNLVGQYEAVHVISPSNSPSMLSVCASVR